MTAPELLRYNLTGYDRGIEYNENGEYVRFADVEAYTKAAIAAAMMGAVKPLEWEEIESDPGGYAWRARKPFGSSYYIHKNKAGLFCWIAGEGDYGSLESAKADAQADYAARILSALSIPNDASAALEAMMAEAEQRGFDRAMKGRDQ